MGFNSGFKGLMPPKKSEVSGISTLL